MKKLFIYLMACVACVGFTACDKDDDPENPAEEQEQTIVRAEAYFQTEATPLTYTFINCTLTYFGGADTSVTSYSSVPDSLWRQHQVKETAWTSTIYTNPYQVVGCKLSLALDTTNAVVKQLIQMAQDTSSQSQQVMDQLTQQMEKMMVDSTMGLYLRLKMMEHVTYKDGTTAELPLGQKVIDFRGTDQATLPYRLLGCVMPDQMAARFLGVGGKRQWYFWTSL